MEKQIKESSLLKAVYTVNVDLLPVMVTTKSDRKTLEKVYSM